MHALNSQTWGVFTFALPTHNNEANLVKNELHQGHMYVCVSRMDWKSNNQNHSSFALIMDSLEAQNTCSILN
jgi:hypothetical protein